MSSNLKLTSKSKVRVVVKECKSNTEVKMMFDFKRSASVNSILGSVKYQLSMLHKTGMFEVIITDATNTDLCIKKVVRAYKLTD